MKNFILKNIEIIGRLNLKYKKKKFMSYICFKKFIHCKNTSCTTSVIRLPPFEASTKTSKIVSKNQGTTTNTTSERPQVQSRSSKFPNHTRRACLVGHENSNKFQVSVGQFFSRLFICGLGWHTRAQKLKNPKSWLSRNT
jgi:hypothetical protein